MRHLPLILLSLGMMAQPALAQDSERYRLEKSGTGFVRMDTRTGEMSRCEDSSGRLVCTIADDTRTAADTSALEARIKALERRLSALEGTPPQGTAGLPSEQEFEQTLTFMERFFRTFIGVVKEFEDKPATPAPPAEGGVPQRT